MPPALHAETVPLAVDDEGVVRVGGTRLTLDTIVEAFREGATAEEIAQQYPSVALADIYQVIGYYLRHAAELEQYLESRSRQAAETRALNESRWPAEGIRARLLSRRNSQ